MLIISLYWLSKILHANVLKKAQHINFYTSSGNIYFAENVKFQMQEVGTFINVLIE